MESLTPKQEEFLLEQAREEREPTLNEAIEHMKKHGGHLKGKGNGHVEWEEEVYTFDEKDRLVLIDNERG